jgi:molybdopterin-guanine dinucleotide biosynthesis protein A
MTTPTANAIVLAGGQSSRLGEDKALVPLAGIPLMTRTVRRLHHVSKQIILAGRPYLTVDIGLSTNVTFSADAYPAAGPLVGVYSGLLVSNAELNVVVACDMPLIRPRLLAHLLAAAAGSGAPVVVPEWSGEPQVLPSIYKRGAIDTLRRALDDGERSLHCILDRVQTLVVPEAEVREFDPEGRSFFNTNTRDDLKAAERLLSDRS